MPHVMDSGLVLNTAKVLGSLVCQYKIKSQLAQLGYLLAVWRWAVDFLLDLK